MNRPLNELYSVKTIQEAITVLGDRKGANRPSIVKLAETMVRFRNDPSQNAKNEADSMTLSMIQEMEDFGHDPEVSVKPKDDKFVKEEKLANHNPSTINEGSEQSTDNTPPYPQEGTTEGDSSIESMQTAPGENQMKEMGGGMPGQPGQPPMQMGGGMPGMPMPGMDPGIMKQMAPGMGAIPPMNTPQQMQQMQYTMKNYHELVVVPIQKENRAMREAFGKLSKKIAEMVKPSIETPEHTNRFRETIMENQDAPLSQGLPPIVRNAAFELEETRRNISEMNNQIELSR